MLKSTISKSHRSNILIIIISLSLLLTSSGCSLLNWFHKETPSLTGINISTEILERTNLRELWSLEEINEGIETNFTYIKYHNGILYVLDTNNLLTAIDGKIGLPLWTKPIASPGQRCFPPTFTKNSLLIATGSEVVERAIKTGKVIKRINLAFTASTPATKYNNYIYIGGNNKIFYCLRYQDGIELWRSNHKTEPIGDIYVFDNKVYFTDIGGHLCVSSIDDLNTQWNGKCEGTTPGATIDASQTFLPGSDTALRCYDTTNGNLIWKYRAGGNLIEPPVITEDLLYQTIDLQAMVCLDRTDMTVKWKLTDGRQFLAESGDLSYIITIDNELTVVNNVTGQKNTSFYVPQATMFTSNTQDNIIFMVADGSGAILALQPEK